MICRISGGIIMVRRLHFLLVAMPLFGQSVPSRSARVWFSAHAAARIFSRSLSFSALSCITIQFSWWPHGVSRQPFRLPRIVQYVHWSIVLFLSQGSVLAARRKAAEPINQPDSLRSPVISSVSNLGQRHRSASASHIRYNLRHPSLHPSRGQS